MAERVAVVVNPAAGKNAGRRSIPTIRRELEQSGYSVDIIQTGPQTTPEELESRTRNCTMLVAAGGDGTLNGVAEIAVERRLRLGLVPIGTANVLAREFKIPRGVLAACRLLRRGELHRLDVGRTDRGLFLSCVGAGFDADVVHRFSQRRARLRGTTLASYFATIFQSFRRYRFPKFSVQIDGELVSDRATGIVVGNTRHYGGPFCMTPAARTSDGLLDACIFHGPIPVYVVVMVMALFGLHVWRPIFPSMFSGAGRGWPQQAGR